MRVNFLTAKQRQILLTKITKYLSLKLQNLDNEYQLKEISQITGVRENRLVETKYYDKYQKYINVPDLGRLIGGHVVTIAEIKGAVNPSEVEDRWLDDEFAYHEDRRMLKSYKEFQARKEFQAKGLHPSDILDAYMHKNTE